MEKRIVAGGGAALLVAGAPTNAYASGHVSMGWYLYAYLAVVCVLPSLAAWTLALWTLRGRRSLGKALLGIASCVGATFGSVLLSLGVAEEADGVRWAIGALGSIVVMAHLVRLVARKPLRDRKSD